MHISPEHSLLYLGPASRSCPHTYIYISPTSFTIIIRPNLLAGLPFSQAKSAYYHYTWQVVFSRQCQT
jgi:hypothetical protein